MTEIPIENLLELIQMVKNHGYGEVILRVVVQEGKVVTVFLTDTQSYKPNTFQYKL